MRNVVLGAVAFVAGAVGGWVAVMVAYVLYIQVTGAFDREGAMAMGAAFGIGPTVGVLVGMLAAAWTIARLRRGDRERAGVPPPSRPRWRRLLLMVVLPAIATYYAVAIAIRLAGPAYYETSWAALAASLAPLAAGVAAALLGWRHERRRTVPSGA